MALNRPSSYVVHRTSERGVYGLTWNFTPLSTYDSVVFYAHSVNA